MDDRNGTRYKVEIPVYARTHSDAVSSLGCLLSVSVTGGFLLTTLPARPHTHISLRLMDSDGELSHRLEGEIIWRSFAGVAIVWSEPAAELIRALGLTCEGYDYSSPPSPLAPDHEHSGKLASRLRKPHT